MRFGLRSLLIVTVIAGLVAFAMAPPSPLTLRSLQTAQPSEDLRRLTPTYRAGKWLYELESQLYDGTIDDFHGQEFNLVKISQHPSGKIFRELVVNVGDDGNQDLRARATLVDSLPSFEELKAYKTIAQFDAVFPQTERGPIRSMSIGDDISVQYWGGFTIEGKNLRIVFVTADVGRMDQDDWTLFECDIRESIFTPAW